MDLWIRNQDGTILIKVETVVIDDDGTSIFTIDKNMGFRTITLGVYSNKDRALEVVEEIQDLLRMKNAANLNKDKFAEYVNAGTVTIKEHEFILDSMGVYQMPEK